MISKWEKLTGVVVPLGALYSKNNPVIGEFSDLIPFGKFCKEAGLKVIQLLPVNDSGTQSSPYSALTAFAIHPIYITLSAIPGFTELYQSDKKFAADWDSFVKAHKYGSRYNYDEILNSKIYFLQKLFESTGIFKTLKPDQTLSTFIKNNGWLKPYCVYKCLKWDYMQASWKEWKKEDQSFDSKKIEQYWKDKTKLGSLLFYAWCQQIASNQFENAVKELHKMGLLLKGDLPILMNEDSCDAWYNPEFFNQNLRAGAPSDGENPAGQNWGFPTYNWKNLAAGNYSWWKDRLTVAQKYYDAYRLDHILGFFRIWAIPEGDCNALNGHTEPYAAIKKEELYEAGFDDDRIRWLSKPHIPTSCIQEITNDYEKAHKVLEIFCNQLPDEELWLFKDSIKGSSQFWSTVLPETFTKEEQEKIKSKLTEYWSNRTLHEIAKNKLVPMWTYKSSTSWGTLNDKEKQFLEDTFTELNDKNEKLWQKQAENIFTSVFDGVKMIPCGEDLGVGIACVPKTMKKHNILGLRVVRWSRYWEKENQPYVDFKDYEPLSITTTSVHDSSTLRGWYEEIGNYEKGGFDRLNHLFDSKNTELVSASLCNGKSSEKTDFTPETAFECLKKCAKSASIWYINPLQDYLYMNKKYWLKNAQDERINVPGSVNSFNWTYRMPVSIDELLNDKEIIKKINSIAGR